MGREGDDEKGPCAKKQSHFKAAKQEARAWGVRIVKNGGMHGGKARSL
jgi:hypothetical protein